MALETVPLTEDDVKKRVLEAMDKIPCERVYFELRKYRVRYIKEETIILVKCCMALRKVGLPITQRTVNWILGRDENSLLYSLHQLGDKKILVFKRDDKRRFTWLLNPIFVGESLVKGDLDGLER